MPQVMGNIHRVIETPLPVGVRSVTLDEQGAVLTRKVIVSRDLPPGALAVMLDDVGVVIVPDHRLIKPREK